MPVMCIRLHVPALIVQAHMSHTQYRYIYTQTYTCESIVVVTDPLSPPSFTPPYFGAHTRKVLRSKHTYYTWMLTTNMSIEHNTQIHISVECRY